MIIDLLLIASAVGAVFSGFRRGFLQSLLSNHAKLSPVLKILHRLGDLEEVFQLRESLFHVHS